MWHGRAHRAHRTSAALRRRRATGADPADATGEELSDPSRGGYEPVLLAVDDPLLEALTPDALAAIVRRDGVALRERAAAIV